MSTGEYVRTKEILLFIFMFVVCFAVTEIIVSQFFLFGAFRRFTLRVLFLFQYSLLIYFLFDYYIDKGKQENHTRNLQKSERKSFTNNTKK